MHLLALVVLLPVIALVLFVFLPFPVALVAYLCLVAVAAVAAVLLWHSARQPAHTGEPELVGEIAVVAQWRDNTGEVYCHGEIWQAVGADSRLQPGQKVRVVAVHGLTLKVVGLEEPPDQPS